MTPDMPTVPRTPIRNATAEAIAEDDIVVMLTAALATRVIEIAGDHEDSGDALDVMVDAVRDMYRHGDLAHVAITERRAGHPGVVDTVVVTAVTA